MDAKRKTKLLQLFANLRDRWRAEQEYEDFSEYVTVMKGAMPSDVSKFKMTKRPFRVEFATEDKNYFIKLEGAGVAMYSTKVSA